MWGKGCEVLILFQNKICNFSHPISDSIRYCEEQNEKKQNKSTKHGVCTGFYHFLRIYLYFPDIFQVWKIVEQISRLFQEFKTLHEPWKQNNLLDSRACFQRAKNLNLNTILVSINQERLGDSLNYIYCTQWLFVSRNYILLHPLVG